MADTSRPRRIRVYRNGDQHYPGRDIIVKGQNMEFDSFLDRVTDGVHAPFGAVRKLYTPSQGHRVKDLSQLEDGKTYIAAGPEKFRPYNYGGILTHRDRIVRHKTTTLQPQPPGPSPKRSSRPIKSSRFRKAAERHRPTIVMIHRNGDLFDRGQRIVLSPGHQTTWEMFLQIVSNTAKLPSGAADKVYTVDGRRVMDMSEILSGESYVAVGRSSRFKKTVFPRGAMPLAKIPQSSKPRRKGKHPSPRRSMTLDSFPNKYAKLPPVNKSKTSPGKRRAPKASPRARAEGTGVGHRIPETGLRDDIELAPAPLQKVQAYNVTVDTGSVEGAGTDANVFLTIFGTDGILSKRKLNEDSFNFSQGSSDVFALDAEPLGEMRRIRLEHDNSGANSAWFCKRVAVRDVVSGTKLYFHVNRWLADDREPYDTTFEANSSTRAAPPKAETVLAVPDTVFASQRPQDAAPTIADTEGTKTDAPAAEIPADAVDDDDDHQTSARASAGASDGLDEEQAAVAIQSAYRGHQTRKEMKEKVEEEQAAVAIQSAYRGHQTRKELKAGKDAAGPHDDQPDITSSSKYDAVEKEITGVIARKDRNELNKLWGCVDYNGNNKVSLAEIDKFAVERYPVLNSKPALMRAYKQTTLRDGDGDAWVEKKEFIALLRNLLYFNKCFDVFDEIDTGDDRRVDVGEFKRGLPHIGMSLSEAEAEAAFGAMDRNGGGQVLFDEFCAWVAEHQCPVDEAVVSSFVLASGRSVSEEEQAAVAIQSAYRGHQTRKEMKEKVEEEQAAVAIQSAYRGHQTRKELKAGKDAAGPHDDQPDITSSSKYDAVEKEITGVIARKDRNELNKLWGCVDYNGNNKVSLAEIDKFAVERYPVLNSKPALMRAYKQTTLRDGDGDAWVEKKEFIALLRNLLYFNKCFDVFDEIDTGDDRRVDVGEFKRGLPHIGMSLSEAEAEAAFGAMDRNGGGQVLFDEFCAWVAEHQCPVDEAVVSSFVLASGRSVSEEEQAAVAIQSAYRGHQTRKEMKEKVEEEQAAVAIQSAYRGHQTRKELKAGKDAAGPHDDQPDITSSSKYDAVEKEITGVIARKDRNELNKLWGCVDYNGNNKVSLAEIDKFAVERYPVLNSKPALMRAYKQTTLRDGDGDAWVEKKEFIALLRNLLYFNKCFDVFDEIDTGDDRRVDVGEFKRGLPHIGMSLSEAEAEAAFGAMDRNGGGQVLFDEFCAWVAEHQCPVDEAVVSSFVLASGRSVSEEEQAAVAIQSAYRGHQTRKEMKEKVEEEQAAVAIQSAYRGHQTRKELKAGKDAAGPHDDQPDITSSSKYDAVEKEITGVIARKDRNELNKLWGCVDYNGNNKVSLAEIDKFAVERYPVLNSKPALMRAYKQTTLRDGDGDAWVEKKEFIALLRNLLYFNKCFDVFDEIDTGDDRRVDVGEFKRGLPHIGMSLSEAEAEAAFGAMDRNGGGQVLFDEFCAWVAEHQCPVDEAVVSSFVLASERSVSEEEQAAVAIQSAYRGHQTRKELKAGKGSE